MTHLRFLVPLVLAAVPMAIHAQNSPEPGVQLTGMVTAVEHPASGGDPVVTAMHPNKLSTNLHTGSNVAKGLVYANQSQSIETAGAAATTILKSTTPTFYIRIDPEDPNDLVSEITLVHTTPTPDTRVVVKFTSNVFGGSRKRKVDEVKVVKAKLDNSTVKITPSSPLAPGEYGLIFLPPDNVSYGDRVYDFAVQP